MGPRRRARGGGVVSHPRAPYQPDAGDLIYLDFDPHAGREQAGHRPGLVLSPLAFNFATGLAYILPITNQLKGSGMEVGLPAGLGVTGGVLCDNMRAQDWLARRAEYVGKAPKVVIDEVKARFEAILQLNPELDQD